MKAVLLHGYGGVDQLSYEDTPQRDPGPGEVLVKVEATSINPADLKTRRGDMKSMFSLDFPAILGHDLAGTVVRVGPDTPGFLIGDRVMGFVSRTYAEFTVAKAAVLTQIPDGLKTEDAAALPLVVTTGAQLIEDGVQPRVGMTVLVTGAVGGVGRTAVYVAKKHGMTVIAGVRAKQRREAESLGADRIVALDEEGEIASLGEVDAIADTVDHDLIYKLMPYIRRSGVLASVLGKPQGSDGKSFTVRDVQVHPDPERLHKLAEAVAAGEFSIPISKRMKLSEVRDAQSRAEKGSIGKILLLP